MIFFFKIRMIVNDISLLNNNIILLGENSVGKTTILREMYLKNIEMSLYIENHKSKEDLFEKISLINDKIKTILIDNIDVNLEIKDKYTILEQLKNKFKNLRFIVSTNFKKLLIDSVDCVYFLITNTNYIPKDSNDIQSDFDAQQVKLFIKKDEKEIDEAEVLYSKIMNKNFFGIITKNDIEEIENFLLTNRKLYDFQREFFIKTIEGICKNEDR